MYKIFFQGKAKNGKEQIRCKDYKMLGQCSKEWMVSAHEKCIFKKDVKTHFFPKCFSQTNLVVKLRRKEKHKYKSTLLCSFGWKKIQTSDIPNLKAKFKRFEIKRPFGVTSLIVEITLRAWKKCWWDELFDVSKLQKRSKFFCSHLITKRCIFYSTSSFAKKKAGRLWRRIKNRRRQIR